MDFSYQKPGIEWLRQRADDSGTAYLGDEPGLGKTRQLLLAATEPVLWVGPGLILDAGEISEQIDRFAPGLDVTQARYTMLNQRRKTSKVGSTPIAVLRPEWKEGWGTVIFDEAQYLKGRKTSWTQVADKIPCGSRFLASGTPIPNWAEELFTSLRLLWPEEAGRGQRYGSYWRWANEWFRCHPTRFSQMAVNGPLDDSPAGWARFYDANLGDRFLMRTRDEVLGDLPPLTHTWVKLPMKQEQRRIYRELKRDYIAWTESGAEVSAWSAGGLHVKLAKICTGLEVLVRDGSGTSSSKLDAFEERVRDQARPSLAVAHFRDSVDAIAERAESVGRSVGVVHGGVPSARRGELIRAFKRGEVDVLCATIETLAEGLNLTAADTIHMVERSYKPTKNQQVFRRIHRIGQTRPCTVIHYLTEKTVDSGMLPLLKAKRDHQIKVLKAREFARLL